VSKLVTSQIQHPSASVPNLVLNADGTVTGPGSSMLVAVKHVLKTDTQVSSSIGSGGNVAISGLSITHEVADAANRLILIAHVGMVTDEDGLGAVGIQFREGSNLIGVGAADGSRTQTSAHGGLLPSGSVNTTIPVAALAVITPGTGSKTYDIHAVRIRGGTGTVYINRNTGDSNSASTARSAASFTLMEVKV